MDYHNTDLLHRALDASNLRQETVSSNIANVNTPGYKAKRVEFESLLKDAMNGTGLQRTNDRHFGVNNASDVKARVQEQGGNMVGDDGNNVAIDTEMAELSANSIYYQSLVSQTSAQYNMLRSVLR
ncbi:flagellar basal body rod protein FlgB [Marinilactibacillus psychrotolerans]|uniref:Flagellar basal body rod protein FlgB n=1 Tax=Marinilactibacillus psychrotolerans TaxID=191770 RepID=A0A5R9C7R7_9LACT|nr:flagellar basal body rod protein FlgB [Marinilactibacillus psychrotolerans]TLQ09363.1 flagellar basal body rod protein FlgB [Marinilactibacillus psychrotolerans]